MPLAWYFFLKERAEIHPPQDRSNFPSCHGTIEVNSKTPVICLIQGHRCPDVSPSAPLASHWVKTERMQMDWCGPWAPGAGHQAPSTPAMGAQGLGYLPTAVCERCPLFLLIPWGFSGLLHPSAAEGQWQAAGATFSGQCTAALLSGLTMFSVFLYYSPPRILLWLYLISAKHGVNIFHRPFLYHIISSREDCNIFAEQSRAFC